MSRLVVPPALDRAQREELKAAVQELPSQAGINLSNWSWKAVRQLARDRFGLTLRRSSCLHYPVSSTGQALLSYSPDFNADEAIWGWARQEVTANLCLGTRAAVREKVGDFFVDLVHRREEVKRRCRTELQARAQNSPPTPKSILPALTM